uniref:Uncharacterized protein n=1 Tax=Mycobacterium leprae TaxID=1769 RepID=O32908_MYCLR|nr:hypothetical protein MLCB1788.16 [Mycobacterium leprae]
MNCSPNALSNGALVLKLFGTSTRVYIITGSTYAHQSTTNRYWSCPGRQCSESTEGHGRPQDTSTVIAARPAKNRQGCPNLAKVGCESRR